jgi:hypothetical protein
MYGNEMVKKTKYMNEFTVNEKVSIHFNTEILSVFVTPVADILLIVKVKLQILILHESLLNSNIEA